MAEDKQFKREIAVRIFTQELSQTQLQSGKDDSQKSDRFTPTYAFSPTGAKINRVFVCGTLTEVDDMETQNASFVKARLVDATGGISIMAGQYQPEVANMLRELADKTPVFVSVVGKPNLYRPSDGGCYVSIRPEDIHVVTTQVVETWTAETAKRTLERIKTLKDAIVSGKCTEDMKAVIAAYDPKIDDLKRMVMIAIGKEIPVDSRPETNGDGGGVKPQANVRKEEETTPPAPAAPPVKASTLKEMVQANIEAGYDLLKELCSLSEDGTVGANAFSDRLVQRRLASPDTAMTLLKGIMDEGRAYEPKMGRIKAVC